MVANSVRPQRVVWTAPRAVALEPLEIPRPGPGEVLLEAEMTLISPGTERAFLLSLENARSRFPSTAGYSFVGHVTGQGAGVTAPSVGQRVVCAASHASHVVASASRCVVVPDGVPSEEAAFFNLLAIALQGVRKARVELGESVVVLGAGLIGQCAMQLSRLSGAAPVVALDLNAHRRSVAEAVSADVALDPSAEGFADLLADALSATRYAGNDAPQVVIEATGFPDAVLTAMDIAGWMARVVLLGSTRGTTKEVNFYRDVHKKGLVLLGAHASTIPGTDGYRGHWTWRANVRALLQLLANGRLNVRPLITHCVPAASAPGIYTQIADWSPLVLGALLLWRDGT